MSKLEELFKGDSHEPEAVHGEDKWLIYHGLELADTLDFDPLAAIKRLEIANEQKDAIIAEIYEQNSELTARLIEAEDTVREALAGRLSAEKSNAFLTAVNYEVRVKLRRLSSLFNNSRKKV